MFDLEGYESDKKAAEAANDLEALKWLEEHKNAYEDICSEDDEYQDEDSDDEEESEENKAQ